MTDGDGKAWNAQSEFVYMTPIVSATQPITPFVDNLTPIDVATLPNQGIGGGCPQAPPPGVNSLCQRIYTLMYDLLADNVTLASLSGARLSAGLDDQAPRRMKMACSFQYPVRSAGGVGQLGAREGEWAVVILPSGEMRRVRSACRATIGQLGNLDWINVSIGKAGRARHMGKRPHTRAKAMNPIDHPLGDSLRWLPEITHPVWVGAGTADPVVVPLMAQQMHDAAAGSTARVLRFFQGGTHYFEGQPDILGEALDALADWAARI